MRKRDTQRSKVYAWERREFAATAELGETAEGEATIASITTPPTMELSEIAKLYSRIRRDYDLSATPELKDGRGCRKAFYRGWDNTITLPRWSRVMWVALHEAAHWLEWHLVPGHVAPHGREFVGIYMELLRRYHGQDLNALCRSANDARIDFAPNSRCTARYFKQHGMKHHRK